MARPFGAGMASAPLSGRRVPDRPGRSPNRRHPPRRRSRPGRPVPGTRRAASGRGSSRNGGGTPPRPRAGPRTAPAPGRPSPPGPPRRPPRGVGGAFRAVEEAGREGGLPAPKGPSQASGIQSAPSETTTGPAASCSPRRRAARSRRAAGQLNDSLRPAGGHVRTAQGAGRPLRAGMAGAAAARAPAAPPPPLCRRRSWPCIPGPGRGGAPPPAQPEPERPTRMTASRRESRQARLPAQRLRAERPPVC